jgi:hypothetical protein
VAKDQENGTTILLGLKGYNEDIPGRQRKAEQGEKAEGRYTSGKAP